MELSSPKLKKLPIFQEETIQARKVKKRPTLKKFLIFSQRKFFLYFGKWNFLASSLKTTIFYQRKSLIFQEGTCKA